DLICQFTGMDRATFANTGSEAVLAALRIARTVTGRDKVATFSGDYHGIFDEMLVRSVNFGGQTRTRPVAPGTPAHMIQDVILLDYGDPASLESIKDHAKELAAVIVEPVQSRHPSLQPREFLHQLRRITEELGIPLIFDEVVTGFRLGPGGAQEWYGVQADLATYGKVIGGGMPIGVLAGKAKYMDALDGGMWQYGDDSFPEVGVTFFAGTFVRHPLAIAVCSAVLRYLEDCGPELQQNLNQRSDQFCREMNQFFQTQDAPLEFQNCGSIIILETLEDLPYSSLLYFYLREKGVDIWEGRPVFLSTAHTEEDLALVTRAMQDAVREMQDAGFLPGGTNASGAGKQPKPEESSLVEIKPGNEAGTAAKRKGPSPKKHKKAAKNSVNTQFPLTESQLEIWLATQLGDDASRAFNEAVCLHLRGPLDQSALEAAYQQVLNRHDALRATISPEGSFQSVAPNSDLRLECVGLSEQQLAGPALTEFLTNEARLTFDLVQGPLFYAKVFRLADQDHLLLLLAHHIICDGWSFGIIAQELSELYSATVRGETPALTEPMQYAEFVGWQQKEREGSQGAETENYWLNQFLNPPAILDLPTDRPRPAVKTQRGGRAQLSIDSELLDRVKQLAVQHRSTLYTTLLAAYQVLLYRLTGQEDLVVGTSMAGQSIAGGKGLVGHCVNLLPFRSQLDPQQPFSQYLSQVKGQMFDAFDHQNYTYGTLVKKLNLPRDPGRSPLVSVLFNLDQSSEGLSFQDLSLDFERVPKPFTYFDLFFDQMESEGGLEVVCKYNSDLFDATTVQRWLHHYRTLLQGIVDDAEQPVSRLPILSAEERHQILVEWN
ncbi:MAG: aminotransferase class III-fold pyridoxal phosphate-dependent enzyme, partial [Dehalococcoidia bacterium]